jgi:hypothetical protein
MTTMKCPGCPSSTCHCPSEESLFEEEADLAKKLIAKYELPMKLLEIEKPKDNEYTFHFSSETRVDFRLLVRDLQSKLHSKVIMHQVGPRDEAKMVGGYGPCGYEVCCRAWLEDFESITADMAKAQELPTNLAKYTGMCGKLMCCLAYEIDQKEKDRRKPQPLKENETKLGQVAPEKAEEKPAAPKEISHPGESPQEEKVDLKLADSNKPLEKSHPKPPRILRQLPKKKKR